MNGHSDGLQERRPSHNGQWEWESPSNSPLSHIMANNRAIEWLGAVKQTAWHGGWLDIFQLFWQQPGSCGGVTLPQCSSSFPPFTNVPVTRKCHQPVLEPPRPKAKGSLGVTRLCSPSGGGVGVVKSN